MTVAVLLAVLAGGAFGQDDVAEQIERYVRHATTGSPVVRPQAAQRLLALGDPAADHLIELSGDGPRELALLGPDLVEVLAEFRNEELTAKVREALADPDFPWRPAAARSLARTATEADDWRLMIMLADPLATVRTAGLLGLSVIDARERIDDVRTYLRDPDDRVRRGAAVLLDRWGDATALAWLIEDLKRDDRFFARETGKSARFAAIDALEARLGDRFGYVPERSPSDPDNVAAIAAITERCRELWGGASVAVPPIAQARDTPVDAAFGLEVRSCRRGEYYVRLGTDDVLWLGAGNPARFDLPEGASAKFLAALEPEFGELGDERAWGSYGCDAEQYYWQPNSEAKPRTLLVTKGQESVEDLRPAPLGRIAQALLDTLESVDGDSGNEELRTRLAEALAAVGGPLPTERQGD